MKALKDRITALWLKIPKPYPALAKLAANYDSQLRKGAEILFLGDSVVERIAWQDIDKRTIDRMLKDLLPSNKRVVCISQGAYHFNIYLNLLNLLRHMRHKPKLVILPINMRCFSPQWDLNPAWQFEEEIRALQTYPETRKIPAIRINADAIPFPQTDWNTEFEFPYTDLKRVEQFFNLTKNIPQDPEGKFYRRKQLYIFHYLNELHADHRRLTSFIKIMDLLKELKINVLTYITSINYQGAIRYVGEGFIERVRSNADLVKGIVQPYIDSGQVCFLDLQEYLTSENFFHMDELTEHLNQFGRIKIAQALAQEIKKNSEWFE